MVRGVHVAILRNAALLVPAAERAEWFAEWRAELFYVERDATAFCLGSFRDALWLRGESLSVRRALSLDSPLGCVLVLTSVFALTLLVARLRVPLLDSRSAPDARQCALATFWMYMESLPFFFTLNPLGLGQHVPNGFAPALLIRLRRWAFLAIKSALVPPIVFFGTAAIAPASAIAAPIIFLGWLFGFRWALADQRRRCPVCLRLLSNPVEIGNPAHTVLGRYGTELSCTHGHGSLFIQWTSSG